MAKCHLCKSSKQDATQYGEMLQNKNISVHTFCLYLSSNLRQNGEDDEGFLGFLEADIKKESNRVRLLNCLYCRKAYANIGCCKTKCRHTFHLICGLENGARNEFCRSFKSYCHQHVGKYQKPWPAKNAVCVICSDNLIGKRERYNGIKMIMAPCCRNGWFHKLCLQRFANTAGYFFKCPLCNDAQVFRQKLLFKGIFIPNQDAAWELEPNAFAELLERPSECAAIECICTTGRTHSSDSNPFIFCSTCGSTAMHKLCLPNTQVRFHCADCTIAIEQDSGRESLNPHADNNNDDNDEIIDICNVSDKEDLEIIQGLLPANETQKDNDNTDNEKIAENEYYSEDDNNDINLRRKRIRSSDSNGSEKLKKNHSPSIRTSNSATSCDDGAVPQASVTQRPNRNLRILHGITMQNILTSCVRSKSSASCVDEASFSQRSNRKLKTKHKNVTIPKSKNFTNLTVNENITNQTRRISKSSSSSEDDDVVEAFLARRRSRNQRKIRDSISSEDELTKPKPSTSGLRQTMKVDDKATNNEKLSPKPCSSLRACVRSKSSASCVDEASFSQRSNRKLKTEHKNVTIPKSKNFTNLTVNENITKQTRRISKSSSSSEDDDVVEAFLARRRSRNQRIIRDSISSEDELTKPKPSTSGLRQTMKVDDKATNNEKLSAKPCSSLRAETPKEFLNEINSEDELHQSHISISSDEEYLFKTNTKRSYKLRRDDENRLKSIIPKKPCVMLHYNADEIRDTIAKRNKQSVELLFADDECEDDDNENENEKISSTTRAAERDSAVAELSSSDESADDDDPVEFFTKLIKKKQNFSCIAQRTITKSVYIENPHEHNNQQQPAAAIPAAKNHSNSVKFQEQTKANLDISCIARRTRRQSMYCDSSDMQLMQAKVSNSISPKQARDDTTANRRKTVCSETAVEKSKQHRRHHHHHHQLQDATPKIEIFSNENSRATISNQAAAPVSHINEICEKLNNKTDKEKDNDTDLKDKPEPMHSNNLYSIYPINSMAIQEPLTQEKTNTNLDISCIAKRTRRKSIYYASNGKVSKSISPPKQTKDDSTKSSATTTAGRRKTVCSETPIEKSKQHGRHQHHHHYHHHQHQDVSDIEIEIFSNEDSRHTTSNQTPVSHISKIYEILNDTDEEENNDCKDNLVPKSLTPSNHLEISCVGNRTRKRKRIKLPSIMEMDDSSTSSCGSATSYSISLMDCRRSNYARKSRQRNILTNPSQDTENVYKHARNTDEWPKQNYKMAFHTNRWHLRDSSSYHPNNIHHPHIHNRKRM